MDRSRRHSRHLIARLHQPTGSDRSISLIEEQSHSPAAETDAGGRDGRSTNHLLIPVGLQAPLARRSGCSMPQVVIPMPVVNTGWAEDMP
jgi:hypothetical protein